MLEVVLGLGCWAEEGRGRHAAGLSPFLSRTFIVEVSTEFFEGVTRV